MKCQHRTYNSFSRSSCQREATHKTASSNRGARYYCKNHAENNYKRLKKKSRKFGDDFEYKMEEI